MTIADNVKTVREKIINAAVKVGRDPQGITLVAAAKMNPPESVRAAIEAGVDAIGENKVQEMMEKNKAGAYKGAPLHFIGHLQSNKVRHVVGLCNLIESVDSVELLQQISRRAIAANILQDVLIEVNIGMEPNKSGVFRQALPALLEQAHANPGVRVQGLMAIPPVNRNISKNNKYFDEMYNLFVDIRAKEYDNIHMNFLSMGMSDSFVEAICAGSNMVRIGSAIFGHRQY